MPIKDTLGKGKKVAWFPIEDLSYGEDSRGDEAYFIDEKHITGTWRVDKEAALEMDEEVFFRVIKDGKETDRHGWLRKSRILQWG